ncbi:hypothetical protein TcYC6_0028720 [Trypanosoma cruzi]|nr:hypothetical protein TcYC6_0028720 [Trypanosoma cruzi]
MCGCGCCRAGKEGEKGKVSGPSPAAPPLTHRLCHMDVILTTSPLLVSSSPLKGGASTVFTQVPQPWSLLAHHRNSRYPHPQGKAEMSSTSTCGAAEGMSERGGFGASAGTISRAPCSPMGVQEEEARPYSPTVSTVAVAWGKLPELLPSTEPLDSRGGAGGGDGSGGWDSSGAAMAAAAAETMEKGRSESKLLTFLRKHASPLLKVEKREALGAFAAVLQEVRELHLSQCPLCAPRRPPNWWTSAREEKRCRDTPNDRSNRNVKKVRQQDEEKDDDCDEYLELDVLGRTHIFMDAERKCGEGQKQQKKKQLENGKYIDCSQTSLTKMHQRLYVEAVEFLEHVYSRRDHLHATCPVMYALRPEAHLLRRECAALGGIVLLEALLLGL